MINPVVPPHGLPYTQAIAESAVKGPQFIGTQQSVNYSPFTIVSSTSFNESFDGSGNIVGYSTVTETRNEKNGYSVFKFTDKNTYPDISLQKRINSDMQDINGPKVAAENPPFTPLTSYSFARGLLKEQLIYNNSNVLVKKILNNYSEHTFAGHVTGFRCAVGLIHTNGSSIQNTYYNVGYYNVLSKTMLLQDTEEIDYLPLAVSRKINYQYDVNYPSLVKSVKSINSHGDITETIYKYVSDRSTVNYDYQAEIAAASALENDGRYATLLEETTKSNNAIVNITKTGFKSIAINGKNLVIPSINYAGLSAPLPKMEYHNYDEFGNVLKASRTGGIITSTKWGYNNLYPVAVAQNAGPDELFIDDFEEANGSNVLTGNAHSGKKYYSGDYPVNFTVPNSRAYKISYYYYSDNKWNYSGFSPYTGPVVLSLGEGIDKVVIIPEDAQLNSSTYDSLNGMTSTTDARGQTTHYEYDDFQRLQLIRDHQGNIVKKYDYHYKP